jgi:polysaccharide pyruvyl transferase WcaK-like protein
VSRARKKIALSITLTAGSDLGTLAMFDHVYVRDNRSLDIGFSRSSNVRYLPDATFLLHPNRRVGRKMLEWMFDQEGILLREKVVVVVVSAYIAFNSNQALARDFLNFLKLSVDLTDSLDRLDASIVFLPFSTKLPHDDRMSNAFVGSRSRAYDKNHVVYDRMSVKDTMDVVAAADAVVSTRLHSTIFATIAGVPFIDLTHHDKNLGFIETIGKMGWSIPLWGFSAEQFRRLLGDFVHPDVSDDPMGLDRITARARDQLNVDILAV